jgi:hypothetical protein
MRRNRKLIPILFFLCLTFFINCGNQSKETVDDPCEGVSCSGKGVCVVNNNEPSCICKEGYESVGLRCVKVDSSSFSDIESEILSDGLDIVSDEETDVVEDDKGSSDDILDTDDVSITDTGKICKDTCEKADMRICENNNSWKICGDFNLDGCLEWSEIKACPQNAICKDGFCDCGDHFMDCDGASYNGCESDILEDVTNCGKCGNYCLVDNGTGKCQEGKCIISQCNPGWDDCDISTFTYDSKKTPTSEYYMNERAKANDYYNYATKAVVGILINHLLSAIEAGYSGYLQERNISLSFNCVPEYNYIDRFNYRTSVNFTLKF